MIFSETLALAKKHIGRNPLLRAEMLSADLEALHFYIAVLTQKHLLAKKPDDLNFSPMVAEWQDLMGENFPIQAIRESDLVFEIALKFTLCDQALNVLAEALFSFMQCLRLKHMDPLILECIIDTVLDTEGARLTDELGIFLN